MNKPVKIALLTVGALAVAGGIYFAVTDSSDLRKLEKEVEKFVETGVTNIELVTKGEFSKVESMLKSDFKKAEEIANTIKETVIEDTIKIEELAKDTENFVATKLSLAKIKESLDNDIAILKKVLTEEELNIRADEEQLSKEVKEKYKELLKKSKLNEVIKDLEKERDIVGQKIIKAEEYLNHLINFKAKWKFIEGKFVAIEESFQTECDKILDELKNIGK